jgi:hypothetical protein
MKRNDSNMAVVSPSMAVTHVHESPAFALVKSVAGRYRHWLSCERRPETIVRKNVGAQHHWHISRPLSHQPQFRIELAFASDSPALHADAAPESLVFRTIFDRLQRHETIIERTNPKPDGSSPSSLRGTETDAIARPVERIVQSNRKATTSSPPEVHSDISHHEPTSASVTKGEWPSVRKEPITLPETEVSRLADQVIRTIDRRVLAQRERLGRR